MAVQLKSPVVALVAVITTLVSSTSAQTCFLPGECTNSPHVGGVVVASKEDCLQQCEPFNKPVLGIVCFNELVLKFASRLEISRKKYCFSLASSELWG